MERWIKILLIVLAAIFFFAAGYFFSSYYNKVEPIESETVIAYVKGDTITREITKEKLVPYKVEVPVEIAIPTDTDSLYAEWKKYIEKRSYHLDFSEDTLGTFTVDAEVQYNELISSKAFIQPLIKTVTTTNTIDKKRFIQGYAMIGTSVHNFNTQKISGGVEFVERFDVGASVIRMDDKFSYTIDFGIKIFK